MKTITNTLAAAFVATMIASCALLQPIGKDDEARRTAYVALTAYESTQQAMILYGRLPGCDAEAGVIRFCRNQKIWDKIKVADKLATTAIVNATPVLNGEEADAGQVVAALVAISNVKEAIKEAQAQLGGPK